MSKVLQSAFPEASLCALSDVHKCLGGKIWLKYLSSMCQCVCIQLFTNTSCQQCYYFAINAHTSVYVMSSQHLLNDEIVIVESNL